MKPKSTASGDPMLADINKAIIRTMRDGIANAVGRAVMRHLSCRTLKKLHFDVDTEWAEDGGLNVKIKVVRRK